MNCPIIRAPDSICVESWSYQRAFWPVWLSPTALVQWPPRWPVHQRNRSKTVADRVKQASNATKPHITHLYFLNSSLSQQSNCLCVSDLIPKLLEIGVSPTVCGQDGGFGPFWAEDLFIWPVPQFNALSYQLLSAHSLNMNLMWTLSNLWLSHDKLEERCRSQQK